MQIGGFQKLTLLDYPGQLAAIVFTVGCDFHCPFCHNASLVNNCNSHVSKDEIIAYLQKRKGLLDGVTVTGGEPLMQQGITEFLRLIKDMGYLVKLDTNGSYPQRLEALLAAGLIDDVAMDIKHTIKKYPLATGIPGDEMASKVQQSLHVLQDSGVRFETRTTVVRGIHQIEDIGEIAQWIAGPQPYYLQSYVNSGDVLAPDGLDAFLPSQMEEMRQEALCFCPFTFIR